MYIRTGCFLVIYHMAYKWISAQVVNVLLVGPVQLLPFPWFSCWFVFPLVGCVLLWFFFFADSLPAS